MERLTNEQAKQEAIKKAYGKVFGYVENLIKDFGYVFTRDYDPRINSNVFKDMGVLKYTQGHKMYRPQSLKGIEDNNGWTRIEPDGSNLPTDNSVKYKAGKLWKFKEFTIDDDAFNTAEIRTLSLGKSGITHYKAIEKELLPIY